MGEIADDLTDRSQYELALHLHGGCDMFCRYCYDEMDPEDKAQFDQDHKDGLGTKVPF